MSGTSSGPNDRQLDEHLSRLQAPPPSDMLVNRVRAMAPVATPAPAVNHKRAWLGRAAAIGGILVTAAIVQLTFDSGSPVAPPVAVSADPAGEIPVPVLAETEQEPAAGSLPTEPFSIAGLPLE